MAKKIKLHGIDMFAATNELQARVANFINCKTEALNIKRRMELDIENLESAIRGIENSRGSLLWNDETDPARIEKMREEIEETKERHQKHLKATARFELSDYDKALYNDYLDAETNEEFEEAIATWCDHFELEARGTKFIKYAVGALGGAEYVRKSGNRQYVNSGGTQFVQGGRTRADLVKTWYGILAEKMIEVGTLKPGDISQEVRDKYAPKKKAENK